MIDLKTKVELPLHELKIEHTNRIMSLGSCFSENIGQRLIEAKFLCDMNPFGALYNPFSIAKALREILDNRVYKHSDPELFFSYGQWHSYMHHSCFSTETESACIELINNRLQQASKILTSLDILLLTFGTARIYRLSSNGRIVANCHKQPDSIFRRELLSVDKIVEEYTSLINLLLEKKPTLQIIFTVSPIRHSRDGFHGNQISKSILLLAIEELCASFSCCHYFPSYEILLDELRDYRFYADDMLHPSSLAISYIWECFGLSYFTEETKYVIEKCLEINKALAHRAFHPESLQYKNFLTQIVLKINRLVEKYPTLDFQKELKLCHTRLKQ